MTNLAKQVVLVLITLIIIYSVGIQERKPNPVNDCYKSIWGNQNKMNELGLYGLGAQDVYRYCQELIRSDIYADTVDKERRPKFIMGKPTIEIHGGSDRLIEPPESHQENEHEPDMRH